MTFLDTKQICCSIIPEAIYVMCQIRNYHDTNRQRACDPTEPNNAGRACDPTEPNNAGANISTNKLPDCVLVRSVLSMCIEITFFGTISEIEQPLLGEEVRSLHARQAQHCPCSDIRRDQAWHQFCKGPTQDLDQRGVYRIYTWNFSFKVNAQLQ